MNEASVRCIRLLDVSRTSVFVADEDAVPYELSWWTS